MNLAAFSALVRKDLVLYFSNRRALVMSIAAPIVIAAFFGSIFGGGGDKPSRIAIAFVDHDRSALSQSIARSIRTDPAFDVKEADEAAAIALAREGQVRAAIVLPAGFGEQAPRALMAGGPKPAIAVHFDPSQATAMTLVRGLLTQHVMKAIGESLGGGGASAFSLPFTTEAVATTASTDRPYNSYAHSF